MENSNDETAGVPQTPASEADTKVEKVTPPVLHVTTPLMRGQTVLDVQQKLQQLGLYSGTCDGIYGPDTEKVVRVFQQSRNLTADGIVGSITLSALYAACDTATGSSSPVGLLAIVEAKKHLGLKESPPGSNKTPFGVWYGHDGLPWCAIFVSYCFAVGANRILCDGWASLPGTKAGKGCAYVPSVESWLKSVGAWRGRSVSPQPGDIVIFNLYGTGADHIGIVVEDLGGGNFTTIEGNTSVGNDSDGGEVMYRTRKLSQIDGLATVA